MNSAALAAEAAVDRPLAGLRVVDMVCGGLAPLTRYLAELGACVDRVDRELPGLHDVATLAANRGKHVHVGGPNERDIVDLLNMADAIVADSGKSIDLSALRSGHPRLVTMTVSDFGSDTELSDWQATDPVLHALSGELSRSGIRGRPPLLPPGELAYQCAATQAAYALIVALYHAQRSGFGDHIDFSALDGAVQALDPGFGVSGSATMGKPANLLSRDRPPRGFQYPILPCADGHVRLCLLAKRQWQGMFRWMGEPSAFASPEFEKLAVRYKSSELLPAIAAFFAKRTRAELEDEGQRFGVPISGLLTFGEYVATEHVRIRGAICPVELADGRRVELPSGIIVVDGERMSGGHGGDVPEWPVTPTLPPTARPFEGLKVLDLGVIVVGAEQGRLLADQGADVVKVESRAYPDGNRQSYLTYGLSVSFAAGHRNKRSLGINLRDPEGRALFLDLAAKADIILSNFKPGTLEALGLGPEDVMAVNPRIVMVDSSAFGATGPWSGRMGYGPLVRAATGLALAWRYPDDPEGYSDSVTIYPDHVAARIGAMAAVALLIRRLRTGRGGAASIAQSEVMLGQFGADVARLSLGMAVGDLPNLPWGAYAARGDDAWCVITVRDERDWAALCGVIGFPEGGGLDCVKKRLAARQVIDAAIDRWLSIRSAEDAAVSLQAAGIPAAPMLRVGDLPDFPYFRERDFFRVENHPFLREAVIAERGHAKGALLAAACAAPAPLTGEHSAEIVAEWLGLPPERVEGLISRLVLEPTDPWIFEEAARAIDTGPSAVGG